MVDTALVLCLRDVLDRLEDELAAQAASLVGLAREHRATVMSGRTLTQHAVPITFGLKAATWLSGLSDATEALQFAIGSNNVFDVYPDRSPIGNRPTGVGGQYPINQYYLPYTGFSPFGFNGRFIYGRVGFDF